MKRIKNLVSRGGVLCISPDQSVLEAAAKLIKAQVGALVVCENEEILGIFTRNDVVRCCASQPKQITTLKIAQVMTQNPYTVTTDENLDDVIAMMINKRIRHVPVTELGRVVGMVTPIDILQYQKNLLDNEKEEIIRYIRGIY